MVRLERIFILCDRIGAVSSQQSAFSTSIAPCVGASGQKAPESKLYISGVSPMRLLSTTDAWLRRLQNAHS
ncbi:MAG: hypothetical protein F6J93_18430 [Oscillatoria sp. SIO1A7]|nr:hypothetical protein [Oscillatoria sp. SIO1A7]